MEPLLKIFPLMKVDEAAHMVWGCVTSETPDSDKEICDYVAAKAAIKAWSDETLAKTTAAGQDPSLGNMRVMHQLQIGGKAIKIEYKDDAKQVWVGSEPANEDVWHLLKGGFLTAHSIGGNYAWKKPEGDYVRYAPTIGEISYVDKGANPDASFAYVKADGTVELRKFAKPGPAEEKLLQKIKAASLSELSAADVDRIAKAVAESLTKGVKYLVPDGKHLPYTGEDGKPDHTLMGAAWAALHGGYRGNKYQGPDKEKAIAHLKEIYRSEGMETPSEKVAHALHDVMEANEFVGDSILGTELQKFTTLLEGLVSQLSAAKGEQMKPEEIKKAAAALGISEEDFKKKFVDADALAKALKGVAALHAHIEKAMAHHDGMAKAHGQMSAMHEAHAAHLGKCMKACKAVMGDEGEGADKALKALLDELKAAPADDDAAKKAAAAAAAAAANSGGLTKADLDKAVADAVKKAVDDLPKPDPRGLRIVPRDGGVEKAEKNTADPLPV